MVPQMCGVPLTWTARPIPPPVGTFAVISAPVAKLVLMAIHAAPAFSSVHTKPNTSLCVPQTFDFILVSALCVKRDAKNNWN